MNALETLKFLMISTHYPPYHLGGDAVFVDYLSRELVKCGHEVHVLHNPSVYELIRKPTRPYGTEPCENGIHTHMYTPKLRRTDAVNALMLGLWRKQKRSVTNLAHTIRPDVVHWHNTRAFIGRPFVSGNEISLYTSHDYGAVCPRSNLLKPSLEMCTQPNMCTVCCLRWKKPPQLWRIHSKRVIDFPTTMKIIAPSEFVANRLLEDGIPEVKVLRNFVPDPSPTWSEDYDVTDSLVYLGMLEKHKGLRTLVKAFEKSADKHGFTLDVVGTGSLAREIERMTLAPALSGRIRVHGFLAREDADRLRRRAAAQIVPSEWYENCPLTVLEAFSMGVPVLASDSGGIPEIVDAESGSMLFRCGDANALADIITQMWEERGETPSRRRKARRVYETRFTPRVHIDAYMNLIGGSSRADV